MNEENKDVIVSGIQQIGVGVRNVEEAFEWYKKFFGMDIIVFDEHADAEFMLPYTGGTPKSRHACLALNLQGGGGFEIWQHKSFEPRPAAFDILPGDLGIYSCKIKCKNAGEYYDFLKKNNQNVSPRIYADELGRSFFYVRDPFNNLFQIVQPREYQAGWLFNEKRHTGGVYGAVVGTHDLGESMKFYKQMLGYDKILCDSTKNFDDFNNLGAKNTVIRRVILTHSEPRKGPFSEVLGPSEIELIQAIDNTEKPRKIFQDRMWGELGFIQICYDIRHMDALRKKCKEKGYPFTVDSQSYQNDFNMGDAGGDFAYNEDPSGTLIEYVQTNKISIAKKFGLALDLTKRSDTKPISKIIAWCLRFLRK